MRSTVLSFVLISALNAGVYDYKYNAVNEVPAEEKNNPLYYGDFERIIRYDAIPYTPGNPVRIKEHSGMEKMYQSIDSYTQAKVPYTVSVVGHTRRDHDNDFETAQESTFFGYLQHSALESVSNADANRAVCARAVDALKQQLLERNVPEGNIVTECRDGSQPLYLENDADAQEKNYRVMVTLYANKVENKLPPVASKPAPSVSPKPVVEADSDGDGVMDPKDQCPNTPQGYKVDESGCPREVTLHINFATASAVIPESSAKEIDELQQFMHDFPTYNVDIIGHTDSVGSDSSNEALSLQRAKSLENLLIEGGISAERIRASGMGERMPVASNTEPEGRAQNRRTEVKLYVNKGQ